MMKLKWFSGQVKHSRSERLTDTFVDAIIKSITDCPESWEQIGDNLVNFLGSIVVSPEGFIYYNGEKEPISRYNRLRTRRALRQFRKHSGLRT